jgi:hypothetical protein
MGSIFFMLLVLFSFFFVASICHVVSAHRANVHHVIANVSHVVGAHHVVGALSLSHRDYRIGSNFWKFCLIRTGFTLNESISLVKVLRLFRLERIFLCLECGHGT